MSPVDDEKKGKRRKLHQQRIYRQAIAHQRPGEDVNSGVDEGKEVNKGERGREAGSPGGEPVAVNGHSVNVPAQGAHRRHKFFFLRPHKGDQRHVVPLLRQILHARPGVGGIGDDLGEEKDSHGSWLLVVGG